MPAVIAAWCRSFGSAKRLPRASRDAVGSASAACGRGCRRPRIPTRNQSGDFNEFTSRRYTGRFSSSLNSGTTTLSSERSGRDLVSRQTRTIVVRGRAFCNEWHAGRASYGGTISLVSRQLRWLQHPLAAVAKCSNSPACGLTTITLTMTKHPTFQAVQPIGIVTRNRGASADAGIGLPAGYSSCADRVVPPECARRNGRHR